MTIDAWLSTATTSLTSSGIGTARLDALVLLEDCLGKDRALLLAHPETTLTPEHLKILGEHISQRATHVPLAYIRGKTEFYGRDFTVNESVLEPRPESETMIDLLKKIVHGTVRLADVGSGSGCLGITAALELELEQATFIDIDAAALQVARLNARQHNIQGDFIQSNLLEAATGPYDIILANLPYVPDNFHINEAALREPDIAIFGGHDGLDLYRRMFEQLQQNTWQPTHVFTEALPPQHEQLAAIAVRHGFRLSAREDFIQVFTRQETQL
jgi:release factor glutamine methyltransferase